MAPTSATASTTLTPVSGQKEKTTTGASDEAFSERRSRVVNNSEPFLTRSIRHPIHERKRLNESYEKPVSGREGWWRQEIKETPLPGSYGTDNFISDILRKPNTYRFKSDGRRRDPNPYIKRGRLLLPGAYQHQGFVDSLRKTKATYGFKATDRNARDYMNLGRKDKDVNVCPTTYSIETHMSLTTDKLPSTHWYFRSQANRFPTIYFKPKDGPGPGNYEPTISTILTDSCDGDGTSSFVSKTPRFKTAHTRVPGPGHYERTCQAPMPSTITKMGRQHGLFFSSAF